MAICKHSQDVGPYIVSRALRMISEGALDETSLEEFSARLGVSSRHLRRLFVEHLGVSPLAIATARRVHIAVRLIQETELPITEIAFAAGFNSIRQFNHAVLSTFGQSPTQIRNHRVTVQLSLRAKNSFYAYLPITGSVPGISIYLKSASDNVVNNGFSP